VNFVRTKKMADTAVDALRRKHAAHRAEADVRRRRVYGEEGAQRIAAGEAPVDNDAMDNINDMLANTQGLGGMGLFRWVDVMLLACLLSVFWLIVKAKHDVDLAQWAWQYLKPHYDEGFFDSPDPGATGDL
jgi:hypothetical protein